jgi:hypothetical protein
MMFVSIRHIINTSEPTRPSVRGQIAAMGIRTSQTKTLRPTEQSTGRRRPRPSFLFGSQLWTEAPTDFLIWQRKFLVFLHLGSSHLGSGLRDEILQIFSRIDS